MFPEPELLGVDLIIPDFRPLERFTHRRAGPDPRARGSHRRGRARAAARQGTGLRHGVHARAGRAKLEEHGEEVDATAGRGQAARARHGRLVRRRVPARHAQHAGLRRAGRSRRRAASCCTPATSRSIRRRSTASTSTFIASRSSAPPGVLVLLADSTNVERRGFSGSELDVIDAFEEIFTSAKRQDRRRDVRVEHLPDADPRRPGGAVRSPGGVRRPRRDRQLGDRAAARLPADSGRRADPRQRRAQLPGAGRGVHLHRLAGRAAGGAVAHRHRRPPPRQARARTTWWCSRRARFPATRRRSAG